MWRSSLDRLPTQNALRRRNVQVGDGLCVFCGETEESVDHLFSGCRVACGVWIALAKWCKIPHFFVFSLLDVIKMVSYLAESNTKKERIYGIIIEACWTMWKARNDIKYLMGNLRMWPKLLWTSNPWDFFGIGVDIKRDQLIGEIDTVLSLEEVRLD
ncbi:uncharacterized protein LOC143591949 [Bidens hawaiensis]|uniref:uncharacterized protein LOC143591949 n=1 Tax=Bidens hawaiensis TaxID=980011 RepID=UPI0040498942